MSDKSNPLKQPPNSGKNSTAPKVGNNFIPKAQIRNSPGGNMRPNPGNVINNGEGVINRPEINGNYGNSSNGSNSSNDGNGNVSNGVGGINGISADFMAFLNTTSTGNANNVSIPNTTATSNTNPHAAANPQQTGPNANAVNRLETIRQYYMQLSNNLRLITQQLQTPDLTSSKRQALLMEQARANAAMQEFNEKILKPISASKQQQTQAQMNNQRPPNYSNIPGQAPQVLQFQNRPPNSNMPSVPQQIPQMSSNPNSLSPQLGQSINFQAGSRPPNVNLYSQSGLGIIRPILHAPSSHQQQQQQQQHQHQQQNRSINNTSLNGNGNINVNNYMNIPPIYRSVNPAGSPAMLPLGSSNSNSNSNPNLNLNSNPNSKLSLQQQQLIMNRQAFIIAAQQHQTSISQQQAVFQQRLSVFSRDPHNLSPTPIQSLKRRPSSFSFSKPNKKFKIPVLALPPVLNTSSNNFNVKAYPLLSSQMVSSPSKTNLPNFPISTGYSSNSSKLSSFPSNFPHKIRLADLAKQFKLNLTEEAESLLLKVADEFIDNLARKSFTFASHRRK